MYQKGERRRELILRATLRLVGARGADAVTHRAVAAEAGVPLSATTYYFASKEQLLDQALVLAAREETERLERVVLDLAPRSLSVREWAEAVASVVSARVREDPGTQVALFELGLESTRTPALREDLSEWQAAHLRLAEMGCRAVGSDEPELDATVIVATIAGLMLNQLASDMPDFEERVLRPALERLFDRIASPEPVGA
jgi:DNA-binding transcriptional regulator YbjK